MIYELFITKEFAIYAFFDITANWDYCVMGFESFYCQPDLSSLNSSVCSSRLLSPPGVVRMEQRNDTLLELGVYDDGPFEVGDENDKNPELVPAPANSYLGKTQLALPPSSIHC